MDLTIPLDDRLAGLIQADPYQYKPENLQVSIKPLDHERIWVILYSLHCKVLYSKVLHPKQVVACD